MANSKNRCVEAVVAEPTTPLMTGLIVIVSHKTSRYMDNRKIKHPRPRPYLRSREHHLGHPMHLTHMRLTADIIIMLLCGMQLWLNSSNNLAKGKVSSKDRQALRDPTAPYRECLDDCLILLRL